MPSRAELGMPHSMLRCGVLPHDAAETSKICQGPCEVRPGTTVLEAFAACYSALEVKAGALAPAHGRFIHPGPSAAATTGAANVVL